MPKQYYTVWELMGKDKPKTKNFQLRSELITAIVKRLSDLNLNQVDAAKKLGTTQARISNLQNGKFHLFRLDTLVDMAHVLDLSVKIVVE